MQREAATARFRPGERVRVRAAHPPGHIRTPHYCRGHIGVVERLCGAFANPEELKRPQVEFVLIELVKKHRAKP